ncbi:ABC transporter substrate-binding protein [Leucobacter sp. CSA1]|uniref:ABC transporter substrate-binding protein n=1 Tax=Leucobacter chromiisoli TaxID=2796471 RepID=A0A934Q953_9MICO|nr:ABC transporter substrate-binding protein [Leucobacter chromiisoli]MBK0418929.1 ABC transporter substrate-binding protein [Leucobacter chromiisoli]
MTQPKPGARPDPAATRRRRRVRARLLVAAAVAVAVVAGAVAASVVRDRGAAGEELSIGLIAEPQSLDVRTAVGVPVDQILVDNVYQGLIGLAPGSIDEFVPVLAEEMPEIADEGRSYTFALRRGVTFHSGSPLTAGDVAASLRDTLTAELLGTDAEVLEVDARTVRIELAEPNNQLLWHLANRPGLILEGGAVDGLAQTANGTGPYRFSEWDRGESITLVRNDDYWGAPATLGTAVFRFLPEGRAAVTALRRGELDVHTALLPTLRPEFEGDDDFTMIRSEGTDVFTLAFNCSRAPLDDPRVREALSRAIDVEALIEAQHGDGRALGSPITEQEPGYADLTAVHDYDPEAARRLLVESGQQNLSLTLTAPDHYDRAPLDLLTSQLADVGVSVKVRTVDFSMWLDEVYTNHDYQLSYVDHAEARKFSNYADPAYYFEYDSERVQRLYAESLTTPDRTEEDRLLAEAARQVAEDAPAKWLFNYTPTNVVSDRVSGFPESNTNSRINLEGVTVRR